MAAARLLLRTAFRAAAARRAAPLQAQALAPALSRGMGAGGEYDTGAAPRGPRGPLLPGLAASVAAARTVRTAEPERPESA